MRNYRMSLLMAASVSALLIGQGHVSAAVTNDGVDRQGFLPVAADASPQNYQAESRYIDLIFAFATGHVAPEAAGEMVTARFTPFSTEKALEIPEFMRNVYALGLSDDIGNAVRSALVELAAENPEMTPSLVRRALVSNNFEVRVAQLIDPQCEDPNLPEAMRLTLDCPPLETAVITQTTTTDTGEPGTINGYQP